MPKTGTGGDAARWAQLKAEFHESCGKTWNKDCEDGKLAELYRAALGTSSRTEVQHKGGFAGNWDDDTQPDVDHWLNRMERSKRHGAAAKRMREAADLPEFSPRPKKKQATGAKPKKTSGGDLPAKLLAGWVEQKGEGGAVYYLETATNRIQFDRPTSVAAAAGLPATNGVGDSDVERLLDEFLGTAQQKMQPGGLAAGQGVPDAETQQQQQQHRDPGHPVAPTSLAEQLVAFVKNTAASSDPLISVQPAAAAPAVGATQGTLPQPDKDKLLNLLTALTPNELQKLAGAPDWLQQLARTAGKSAGSHGGYPMGGGAPDPALVVTPPAACPKPNKPLAPMQFCTPLNFATTDCNTVTAMIERELDSEADAMQMKVGADGKCVLVKATAKVEINDMMQYSQAAQKFTQYAAQTGAVKFLCTPLQFSQHSAYLCMILGLTAITRAVI